MVVLKGGMLISSLIGVESRVTKDLDTTIRGFTLTHESAERAFSEICAIDVDDGVTFEYVRTEDIRDTDEYPGIRVFLKANYAPMSVSLSVDMTTGDAITPDVIEYEYPLSFDDYSIPLMAYPLPTCMAEKLETVISRGVTNTRPRDYYDIYMLQKTRGDELDSGTLSEALQATAEKRGSTEDMGRFAKVMSDVAEDDGMLARWKGYGRDYSYVGDITLQDACDAVVEIMGQLELVK
jgi:predicted nucleotidyltransferase component of viral defense system